MRILFSVFCGFWFGLGDAKAEPVDRIAAVVNDEVIALSEVYDIGRRFIEERAAKTGLLKDRREAELEVLEEQIRVLLIEQELIRLQLDVTDQQFNATLDQIVADNNLKDRDALRAAVEREGIDWDSYLVNMREGLRMDLFRSVVIRPRIVENEDAMRDAYNRRVKDPNRPRVADLGALYVGFSGPSEVDKKRTLDLIQDALTRHAAGTPFAELSKELDMAGYGNSGGSMGTFREGELLEEINTPAFSIPVGSVSEPIITNRGIYLIEVRKRELQPVPPYDQIKEDLSLQVYQNQYQREEDAWYQVQRRKSSVEVKIEAPDTL